MTIMAATNLENNRGGNGNFRSLKRKNADNEVSYFENVEDVIKTLDGIDKRNIRTIFKQAKDPVYLAYDHIDKQPLNKIAKDFVKDTAMDFVEFIAKIFE